MQVQIDGMGGSSSPGSGVQTVADTTALTALSGTDGDLAVKLDTNELYLHNGATWDLLDSLDAVATNATAGGATTLLITSKETQVFTGTLSESVILPDATTLPVGKKFRVLNLSTQTINVVTNAAAVTWDVVRYGAVDVQLYSKGSPDGVWYGNTPHSAVTLAAIGSSPNANGATLSAAQVLNIEPASATYGGAVTTAAQTFAGAKSFVADILASVDGTPNIGTATNYRPGKIWSKDYLVTGRYPIGGTDKAAAIISLDPRLYLYYGGSYDFNINSNSGTGIKFTQESLAESFAIFNYVSAYTWLKYGVRIDNTLAAVDASAMFQVVSTTRGSISDPVQTTTQRDLISSPATGLRIYNSTTKRPEVYDGTLWQSQTSPNTAAAQTPADAATPTILGYRRQVLPISGSGGAVTLADLSVSNNLDGDELTILGTSDTNTVTIVAATNTAVNGNCTLASGDALTLVLYSAKWYEKCRSN